MIYFIEHDSAENICHVCADPGATIVPLVNRVAFSKSDGTLYKDASGNDLSPYGLILAEPVGIDAAAYDTLLAEGMQNFTYDTATQTVVKKPATSTGTNDPATT
ncbi:MAG: hypothetical protein JWQ49_4572 [Edaphobacter sp.]|nr:hypothetical protein [Edaphobacter sp.]